MAENLVIKIDGDVSDLTRALDDVEGAGVRAFKNIGSAGEDAFDPLNNTETPKKNLDELGNSGESAMNRIKTAAEGFIAALAASKILKELIDFGKEAVTLASDLQEVQNVVDVTFGEGNEKIEGFAQSAAENFGMSELSAKQMLGTMGAMLKSQGVEAVDEMSMSLVGLAGDMASFYNLAPEAAFDKLRAGISGSTEPLKQLGINMNQSNLEAYALSQGIETAWEKMDQAEQTAVRYGYIMQQTADAQGDFARTSDSMANQTRLMEMNIESLKTTIGEQLLPVVTDVTKKINDILTKAQEVFPQVKESISGLFADFDLGDELTGGLSAAKEQIDILIGEIKQTLTDMFNTPEMETFKETVNDTLGGLLEQIGPLFEWLRAEAEYFIIIIKDVWDLLLPIVTGVIAAIDDIAAAFIAFKTMAAQVVNELINFLKAGLDLLVGIIFMDKDRILNGVRGLKDSIVNIFKAIGKGVAGIFSNLLKGIGDFFSKVWESLRQKFDLGSWFRFIWDGFVTLLETKLNELLDKLPGFMKDLLHIDGEVKLRASVEEGDVAPLTEGAEAAETINENVSEAADTLGGMDDLFDFDDLEIDVPEIDEAELDSSETDALMEAFDEMMAGTEASSEDLMAQYEAMTSGMNESSTGLMEKYDQLTKAVEDAAEKHAESVLPEGDISALVEGASEETILSWQNLRDAMQGMLDVITGGESGEGLNTVLNEICENLNSGIPEGIEKMSGQLTDTLPPAVNAALDMLGRVTYNDNGEAAAGKGNTLYTSLGSIKGLFEDINTAIDTMCAGLRTLIPEAVGVFRKEADAAIGFLEGMWTSAAGAASAFHDLANGILEAADALSKLGGGSGVPTVGGGGIPEFAAAHGGLVNGTGFVGERGVELISTSRNMNVFTNRALEIAQAKVADRLSRSYYPAGMNSQTSISNDNSRSTTVNVGTVLGSDWLGNEMNRRIRRTVEKELFYAG